MSLGTLCTSLVIVACLFLATIPVMAAGDSSASQNVIYQTPFSSDPRWTTNSPTYDYWDPATGRYHFSIEPSTGNYAYTMINNMQGSFTFEYDVTMERVDDGAAFRFGVTGAEMDFNKGPNVITMFSNGKHGQIMSLHLVTVGSKQMEVNSASDDEETSGPLAYKGSTVKFALNKTYHVVVDYDDESKTTTMRVSDKATGTEVWSYFIKTVESLHDMNRIYLGSRGDYGGMYAHASGYIDNVRLMKPAPAETPVQTFGTATEETTIPPVTHVTTRKPATVPTPLPTTAPEDTPESPAGLLPAVLATGIAGALCMVSRRKNH